MGRAATWTDGLVALLKSILACPKPVIARVHGATRAGGVGVVAACDLAIASQSATFALPEVRLGTVPAVIAVVLFRKMGYSRALQYSLTGEEFPATSAYDSGLVTAIADDADLARETQRYIDCLRLAGERALATTKFIANSIDRVETDQAFAEMQLLSESIAEWPEARERMDSFRRSSGRS
jgi:enoyl-CoA hydratase/carnithine racemase